MFRTSFVLLLSLAISQTSLAGDWPAWRGPDGSGHSAETNLPLKWSADDNVVWKIELPGPGNSTPIVIGDKIFVSGALKEGAVRTLMCFSKADGKRLWTQAVDFSGKEPTHKTNPYCSASPVSDGKAVYVWHGSAGVFAYDLNGKKLWQQDLGKFAHVWGNAASPVIYKEKLILSAGPGLTTFLAAYDLKTGEQAWRTKLPTATSKEVSEFHGSWATPVLAKIGDKPQIILGLPLEVAGFDPDTGKQLWKCAGLSKLTYTTPLVDEKSVVAMSGYHGPAIAVRTGGSGDVTKSHRLWVTEKKNPQRVGSGVLVAGHVYILNENGDAWCIEVATGEVKWQERLKGKNWGSMVYADGRLYVLNMDSTTYVLAANPEQCELLATNQLGELSRSSPAISDGQFFVRTYRHLWCIGKK